MFTIVKQTFNRRVNVFHGPVYSVRPRDLVPYFESAVDQVKASAENLPPVVLALVNRVKELTEVGANPVDISNTLVGVLERKGGSDFAITADEQKIQEALDKLNLITQGE